MILGSGLIQASGWTPTWLIRDEFTDTLAAGSVNGTAATPGPGTRSVTDTESKLSVSSGALAIAGGRAASAYGDPGIWYGAQTRAAGLTYLAKINHATLAFACQYGFDANNSGRAELAVFWARSATQTLLLDNVVTIDVGQPIATATPYTYGVVLRSTGAFYLAKGGAMPHWTLLWVSQTGNTSTVYPAITDYDVASNADYVRVLAVPEPFDSDTGLATDVHAGSVSAGTTFTHTADCLIEYTATTVPSGDSIDVQFRKQDATNFWICRINSSGDIALIETVAGSETSRGSAAGVVSSGHRVVIIADGTTIRGYSNNVLRWTYASATNFATATAGELDALGTGGAVSDLITWPRTLSGTAASILNKASA